LRILYTARLSSRLLALMISTSILGFSCKKDENFPPLGDKVVSPIDVASDKSGQYFYAINSDYPRDYNQGSLLVLNTEGQKLGVTPLPRLGRSLTVAGNTLIVTFSNSEGSGPRVILFDITNPAAPLLAKTFELSDGCNPINAAARENYPYWVVSCSNGQIHAGTLDANLANSSLSYVRNYAVARRALHIDTSRNLLFAFPTQLGEQETSDVELEDSKTFSDPAGVETAVPNQIPDFYERNRVVRADKARRGLYQFAVYDLAAGAAGGWQKKEFSDSLDELRWTYFSLSAADGTPDVAATPENANKRFYRTNFWEARPDLTDPSTFYLSHRGNPDPNRGGSLFANNILRVKITGDITSAAVFTSDALSFERIYGFKSELEPASRYFVGDFDIQTVQGQPLLVVNHFKDFSNWPGQAYFSVVSKVIGNNTWIAETSSTSSSKAFYQIALTPSGRALAANFYGNSLILLDVTPGVGITERATNIQ